MNKALDFGVEVSNFEIQFRYNILFWTNAFGKDKDPFIPRLWVK